MKITRIRINDRSGRSRIVTKATEGKCNYVFDRIVNDATAARAIRNSREDQSRRIRRIDRSALSRSLQAFRRFNSRDAKKIIHQTIDLKTPFIRIGDVPLITYMSDKTGSMRAYKHETKIMPILYMHPTKPIGILVGGSLKVRKWLED